MQRFFLTIVLMSWFLPAIAQIRWINPMPSNKSLNDISYTPDNCLFCCGDNGVLLKSKDRSHSWEILATDLNTRIQACFFWMKCMDTCLPVPVKYTVPWMAV